MTREAIIKLETNVDHLSAEEIGAALQTLNDLAEVLDASYYPGIGKKNRPCGKLELLCHKENMDSVVQAVFRHTHTLGLRYCEMDRLIVPRSVEETNLAGQKIRAKTYVLDGVTYQRPEADDLRELARKGNVGMPAMRMGKL